MFYPAEALKKGGRFYLCWVADSWPHGFASLTHRQIWAQDIRLICDAMLEVMNAESGRPVNRFSLRLSSQLMRGLVRLYQRKVNIFLGELCMLNAHVFKHTNKKYNIQVEDITGKAPRHVLPALVAPQEVLQEEPEPEQRVAELIQNSGNVVVNIQDITLKESVIPDFQLPPNDGFGEENPEQTLLEMMMQADRSAAQHSGLVGVSDTTIAQDHSHLQPQDIQMERLSEHDITLFSNVAATTLRPTGDFEKDVPEIPDIPIPEMPAPETDKRAKEQVEVEPPAARRPVSVQETSPPAQEKTLELHLEELEDEPPAKKRRKNKLIIDKKIKISGDVLHVRIGNPDIELRCQDSSDDIIDIRLPAKEYFQRACKPGWRFNTKMASKLTGLFLRNLGKIVRPQEREMEEAVAFRTRRAYLSTLARIEEEPAQEKSIDQPNIDVNVDQHKDDATTDQSKHLVDISVVDQSQLNITNANQTICEVEIAILDPPIPQVVPVTEQTIPQEQIDIADLPTQKLDTSKSCKRKSAYNVSPKRRAMGHVSYRRSQEMPEVAVPPSEANKENIPDNSQMSKKQQITLTSMLEGAGLADVPVSKVLEAESAMAAPEVPGKRPKTLSTNSETPLGSLDRTKVSLGDSNVVPEYIRFISEQWGTSGTLIKIFSYIEMYRRNPQPLTVWTLLSRGPVLPEYRKIIAARCFTSILKLKHHGFVTVRKDPETLEIADIFLGPKFDDNTIKNIFKT